MEDLAFFDVNCQIGMPMCGSLEYAARTEDLLKELDFAGIGRAVVHEVCKCSRSDEFPFYRRNLENPQF